MISAGERPQANTLARPLGPAIQTLQAIMSTETLRMVYFAYVHSIMSHGIILGENQSYSERIFKIQKRVIRIITNSRIRD
jgi:hypothetical protein